jgi:molybdopterin-guanine dinucleotide biosynthesis protein MobB
MKETAAVVAVVGHANTGKTTLIAGLIRALASRGYRVAAIKHAAHGYEIDSRGKDSWRYFQAGANRVLVAGPESLTVHIRHEREPGLAELAGMIGKADLILAEGFKSQPGPKIEVLRRGFSEGRLSLGSDLIAVVSDAPIETAVGGVPPGSDAPGGVPPGSDAPGGVPPGSDAPGGVPPGSGVPGETAVSGAPPGSGVPGETAVSGAPPGSGVPGGMPAGSDMPGDMPPGSDMPGGVRQGSGVPGGVRQGSDVPGGVRQGSGAPGGVRQGSDVPVFRPDEIDLLADFIERLFLQQGEVKLGWARKQK